MNFKKIRYLKSIFPLLHKLSVFFSYLSNIKKLKKVRENNAQRPLIAINMIEHFGDIVACEPVARYVKNKYPSACIVWFVRDAYLDLLKYNPNIDIILKVTCITVWIKLSQKGLFDDVIDLHTQNRQCSVCRIPLNKSRGNLGINTENYYHYGNLLAAFCQSAGIPIIEDQPRVYIPSEVVKKISDLHLPAVFIAFHCSSNEVSRDWVSDKWLLLARRLINELSANIVEIGLQSLLHIKSDHYASLCGRLSLLETTEVLRRAVLFVGVDSGPAHLANAVGTYGIVLLGEYRAFQRYLPYSGDYKSGENANIVYHNGPVADISVETIFDAVKIYIQGINGAST